LPAIVTIEDARKVYASGLEALRGVSLDILEGEILALLGPNGAGKSGCRVGNNPHLRKIPQPTDLRSDA